MTKYLTLEDLLALTRDLGVGPVRDVGLLDSAAHRPMTTVYGTEAYLGLDLKAAVLLESLLGNHPLVDGNERLGWLAVVVFYGLNGVSLDAPDDPAFDLVIADASGQLTPADVSVTLGGWRREAGRI